MSRSWIPSWAVVAGAAGFVIATEQVGFAVGAPLRFLVLDTTLGLLFVVAGALAWSRRPLSRAGPLLVASAVLWSIGSYSPTAIEPVWAIGFAFEGYYDITLAWLALTFPGGRLTTSALAIVRAMGAAFVVRSLGRLLLSDPPRTYPELFPDGPSNPFAVLESRVAFETVETLAGGVIAITAVVVIVIVTRRLVRTPSLARSVVAPVALASVVAMVSAGYDALATSWSTATGLALIEVPEPYHELVSWLMFGARVLVPVGFLIATIRLHAPRGPLARIAEGLADETAPDEIDAALRAYLENDALADELARQLAELRASRARIVSAGDEERRRIERALHDGAQQHLTTIALRLDEARRLLDGGHADVAAKLEETASELRDALQELRELARGIHPAVLADAGLAPALATLVRRSIVPVDLTVRVDGRVPLAAEVTAYYVVAEALTNVARSANATRASVVVSKEADGLRVVVSDDGIGGADPRRGSGILGLSDRVRALDGWLQIESPRGAGTRLEAWLPCA